MVNNSIIKKMAKNRNYFKTISIVEAIKKNPYENIDISLANSYNKIKCKIEAKRNLYNMNLTNICQPCENDNHCSNPKLTCQTKFSKASKICFAN